ncbi:uncharacterized protein RJT20DRAFT_126114 [Scheffersomyces xylosifermentans]|uniref:uncharacterized protein n=1 Tax=Scheffersomyces xylosifermentans TaxID=1304137 RepID=UPI00315CA043
MVLYKRKQVTFVPPPEVPSDLSVEVFFIPQTKEWFLNYEDYLSRMDYYRKRKFVCEITGNSCLNFFEALESEEKEIKGVEKNFPEALREHILRFLQFNRITRLDQLVDKVYLVFKNDYFPGETIFIKGAGSGSGSSAATAASANSNGNDSDTESSPTSNKQRGTIREKVQYGQSEGVTTKYLVVRLNDMQQSIVTNDHISRDRNHFTKWLIKTFIKLTMSRSHKVGAPWVVKDKYAKKYRIPQEFPEDLKQFADSTPTGETQYEVHRKPSSTANGEKTKKTKRSAKNADGTPAAPKGRGRGKRVKDENKENGRFAPIAPKNGSLHESHKRGKKSGTPNINDKANAELSFRKKFPTHYLPEKLLKEFELDEDSILSERSTPTAATNALTLSSLQPTKKHITDDLEIKFDIQNPKPLPEALQLPDNAISWNKHLVKEYRDDIKEAEKQLAATKGESEKDEDEKIDIQEKLLEVKRLSSNNIKEIQSALQSWIFINVYHTVLKLDTFTFDDFVFAMGWNLDQFNDLGRCELLDEIWCAVLSAIVSNTVPTPKESAAAKESEKIFGLQINLPNKTSFIDSAINGKDNQDDHDERGSDSEQDDKILKSDDEDSGNESGDDSDKSGKTKSKTSKPKQEEVTVDEVADNEEADNEEEEDEENDDDTMEVDDINGDDNLKHNAYSVMNYKGTAWHDRLRRRNFKDGNWQCILLGVLSLVEYVPAYKEIIEKVFIKLAPKSMDPTPETVLTQFYEELDIDLKFQTLNILVELLVTGSVVRNYIDECLDASTVLRRERLDNIKEYKTILDAAQKANIAISELLTKNSSDEKTKEGEKEDAIAKRPRLNYSKAMEMSEDELKLSESNEEFRDLWNLRKDSLVKLDQIKKDKREIEKKLTELDCQRVKLLGKDRLYNRYWWFENNGLPTLHGGSNEDDENEDEEKEKDSKNDEDVDDDKDEVLDETYLMGRLWVEGPSNEDLRIHFKTSFEESEKFNVERASAEFQLKQVEGKKRKSLEEDDDANENQINNENEGTDKQDEAIKKESSNGEVKEKKTQIKEMDFNKIPKAFVQASSKVLDLDFKNKEVIKSSSSEVIIDYQGALKTASLIKTLSPMQRKVIEEYPDPLINGSNWRFYDKPEQITKLISWLNPWGKREAQLRKELFSVKDAIISSIEARRKALAMDKAPEEELLIESDIAKLNEKIEQLNSPEESESENEDEIVTGKRNLRRKVLPRKRQKLHSVEEALEYGEIEELKKMKKELQAKLDEKRDERDLSRVLEWVNSKAMEAFDKSLYDGGDKARGKATRKSSRR